MSTREEPLVSVLTPVYNMASFLPECIESVLRQTYPNFEYIIVNNRSTDSSLEIATVYASQDPRIRVHTNDEFVGVIQNHNIAFSLISPTAKYCKVVSADDYIFPDFLARTVEVAEANPSVGIVGSYQVSGSHVKWQGFEYPRAILPGREICRRIFLENDPSFGFGTPTSTLYRADLVRASEGFYPNASPHADTSACFQHLQHSDFGFVYQVLSYERTHSATQSSRSAEINRYASAYLNDVIQYGPFYLSEQEFKRKLKATLDGYYQFLAVSAIRFKGKQFWDYHKNRLQELGHPIAFSKLVRAFFAKALREIVNPEQMIRKFARRFGHR
jgi:glycosyltransferase involved in cell wall biosynthesis